MLVFGSYGCTAGLRTAGVVRIDGGPTPPLVRVGCSRTFAQDHTLLDDPRVDADIDLSISQARAGPTKSPGPSVLLTCAQACPPSWPGRAGPSPVE
jgi:hypothetical protein